MAKAARVSGSVTEGVSTSLDRLAERLHSSRDMIVSEAVESYVTEQTELLDSLEAADRQIDRGEFVTQDDVETWFEARRGRAAGA